MYLQAISRLPALELYELNPKITVVPGFVLTECLDKGESIFTMKAPKFLRVLAGQKILYKVYCKVRSDNVRITVESFLASRVVETSYSKLGGLRIKQESMYALEENGIVEVSIAGAGEFVKLYFTRDLDWPTLYINGVHMHRVEGTTPLRDSISKVKSLHIRENDVVLDTCMGLGYTASLAAGMGAKVYTIEISENVLLASSYNPPSWLLPALKVRIIHGDSVEVVDLLPDQAFTKIIHDPPRFELAGELYSLEFYRKLYRVLRRGGMLYHYTGLPRQGRGRGYGPVVRGVVERLRAAGFYVKGFDSSAQGVIAVKY